MSRRVVVADAGPLIALAKLDRLELLERMIAGGYRVSERLVRALLEQSGEA